MRGGLTTAMTRVAEVLPPKALVASRDRVKIIEAKKPRHRRFAHWFFVTFVGTPHRIGRFLWWLGRKLDKWYDRGSECLAVLFSRRVSQAEKEERDGICALCEFQKNGFCVPCGCPHWTPARTANKNARRRHKCPKARHPGTYLSWQVEPSELVRCRGGQRDG